MIISIDYRPETYVRPSKYHDIKTNTGGKSIVVKGVEKPSFSNLANTNLYNSKVMTKIQKEAMDIISYMDQIIIGDEELKDIQDAIDKEEADIRTIEPFLLMINVVNSYILEVEQTVQEIVTTDSLFSCINDMQEDDMASVMYLSDKKLNISRNNRERLCDKETMLTSIKNLYSSLVVCSNVINKTKSDSAIYMAESAVEEKKMNLIGALISVRSCNDAMLKDIHDTAFLVKELTGNNVY